MKDSEGVAEATEEKRVCMAIFPTTRYRLNELKAAISIARNEKVEIDPLINQLIDNYRATAPELHEATRSGLIVRNGALQLEPAVTA